MRNQSLNILGIRGIPAAHGGFETFAANFAPYMRDKGWKVTVYCQGDEKVRTARTWVDEWNGIRRVHFETRLGGTLGTIEFDLKCVLHVLTQPGVDLVLGYNTAIFNVLQRLFGRHVVINMDGIEWKRQKWGLKARLWLWLNEWLALRICSVPIADHPEVAEHLKSRGCNSAVVIPYGAATVKEADPALISPYGLTPADYFITVARVEPENSILEIVQAFVKAGTGRKLVVLGRLQPECNPYHAQVMAAADDSVIFPGGIYDPAVVSALRFHCIAYMHGHQVGGTNPSLVEALGAGNPVIAHDNHFNRWTTGLQQLYFHDVDGCAKYIADLSANPDLRARLSDESRLRHKYNFTFVKIHDSYHDVLEQGLRPEGRKITTVKNPLTGRKTIAAE